MGDGGSVCGGLGVHVHVRVHVLFFSCSAGKVSGECCG